MSMPKVGCYLAAVGALALAILGLAASAFVYARQSGSGSAGASAAGLDEEGLHFYIVSALPPVASLLQGCLRASVEWEVLQSPFQLHVKVTLDQKDHLKRIGLWVW